MKKIIILIVLIIFLPTTILADINQPSAISDEELKLPKIPIYFKNN